MRYRGVSGIVLGVEAVEEGDERGLGSDEPTLLSLIFGTHECFAEGWFIKWRRDGIVGDEYKVSSAGEAGRL